MQSRIGSQEALVLIQRVVGLFVRVPPPRRDRRRPGSLWARTWSFFGPGLAYKSTSHLRMARWHRDRGPMALLPPSAKEHPQGG
jgi:hypothetical protein